MRGRKPIPKNVVPLKGDQENALDLRNAAIKRVVAALRPRRMSRKVGLEWNRVATILADPTVDRLKARYVDAIEQYCVLCVRLRELNAQFESLDREIYVTDGRHGPQRKTDPQVGQRHETFREWNSLRMELGLGPASERNLLPGQGDLFDEADQHFA